MKPVLILAAAGAALTLAACSEEQQGITAASMPDTSSPQAASGVAPDAGVTGNVPPESQLTGTPEVKNPLAEQGAEQPAAK